MAHAVSIIMPAYNEEACIFENIRTTLDVMRDAGITAEIVAVDDGSSDETLAELRRAEETFDNVLAVRNPYNMGKGMALRTGFEHSTGDIVVFLDADLDLHPSQIRNLIDVLEKTPCDVVVTSKHHPDSRIQYPFSRTIASWIYYLMIKTLFNLPVRDTQTGLKVFRRRVLEDVLHRLLVKKFAYDVELLAVAVRFGYMVREIPVVLDFKRALKWGRICFEDVLSLFIDTLAVFYRLRIMKYYDGERPRYAVTDKRVLIVIRGGPPSEDTVRRLSGETFTRIVCISEAGTGPADQPDILHFSSDEHFMTWFTSESGKIDIVGFIGQSCIPVGSWLRYALRNFDDAAVRAVCGPVLAGSYSTLRDKGAVLVYSSIITRGFNVYLHSFRPFKPVKKGVTDNVFVRVELLKDSVALKGLFYSERYVTIGEGSDILMRYDPDVAVVKKVPPLFIPYLLMLVQESFSDGYTAGENAQKADELWPLVLTVLWLFFGAGWIVAPLNVYIATVVIYTAAIVLTALSCFDIPAMPLFAMGIIGNHIVRAIAFPTGLIMGLAQRAERE